MNVLYRLSPQMILDDLGNIISSLASADGPSPCASPGGPTTDRSGPDRVPANLSAPPASAAALPTSAIYGPSSPGLSASAALQQCLASRLRARLGANGSPEYSLTWKEWAMPRREAICALRASGRRTSGSGCTGWPTPTIDAKDWSPEAAAKWVNGRRTTHHLDLGGAVQLAGWPTTRSTDADKGVRSEAGAIAENMRTRGPDLCTMALLSGWATPTTRDHKDGTAEGTAPINGLLGRQAWLSRAPTAKRGALNPLFSLWLMLGSGALARAWASCAGPATRSSRRSPRSSSPP